MPKRMVVPEITIKQISVLHEFLGLSVFPSLWAAIANHHTLDVLKTTETYFLQFWQLEVLIPGGQLDPILVGALVQVAPCQLLLVSSHAKKMDSE